MWNGYHVRRTSHHWILFLWTALEVRAERKRQQSIAAFQRSIRATCAAITQWHCSLCVLAYGAVFTCVSNKTEASLNTCCSECIHSCIVPYAGVVLLICKVLPQFATASFLYEHIAKLLFCSLFLFHIKLSLLQYRSPPVLETCIFFAVVSPWQHRSNFLLFICRDYSATTTRLVSISNNWDWKQIICSNDSFFKLLLIWPSNRSLLRPRNNERAWEQYVRQFMTDVVCVLFMGWGRGRTFLPLRYKPRFGRTVR
jgi:hypothetical protein